METPDAHALLAVAAADGIPMDPTSTIIVFHSTRVLVTDAPGMARWRKSIFAFLMRMSGAPASLASAPQDLVMEWTTLSRL